MLTVVVHEKAGKTRRIPFQSEAFTAGREADNLLVMDRPNISKHHMRLRRREGKIEVLDLESTNGTYVNGRRVLDPRVITTADRIYVGDFILVLEGDDPAVTPKQRREIVVKDGKGNGIGQGIRMAPKMDEPLLGIEDENLMTSARRVAAAGMESDFLDRMSNRVLQTLLLNIQALNPVGGPLRLGKEIRQQTLGMTKALISDLQAAGELDEKIEADALCSQIIREAVELGPLSKMMEDPDILEIQVVGGGPIRTVRRVNGEAKTELTQRRFSGDRALVLAIQRQARERGFLVEGAQILEGRVAHGFYMYALLPPTQVRTPVLSLRRTSSDGHDLAALVAEGVLSDSMRELLAAAIIGRRRLLICASGGANLDRFMGALVGEIPENLRVACISDTGRLGAHRPGWMQIRRIRDTADTVGLSDAVGVLLRGGIDLLVSQRCRHEDAAAVVDALSGAAEGALVSVWGIDSAHALSRLAALSTVASGAIDALTVALARSVDLLIRVGVGKNGENMQIVEMIEPRVKEGNQILHEPIFQARYSVEDGKTVFEATGRVPAFVSDLSIRGITLDSAVFENDE